MYVCMYACMYVYIHVYIYIYIYIYMGGLHRESVPAGGCPRGRQAGDLSILVHKMCIST